MGFEVAGQIRFAQMMDRFWARREKKVIDKTLADLHQVLEDDYHFGYLVKTDRVGYLRALSKTKYVFRGLNKDDVTDGILEYNQGEYGIHRINPDFMRTLEDFYYGEIRKEANIVDLKLHRYNTLRDQKIEDTINNPKVHTEEYAQNIFNTTRAEMFEMVKRNEAVFVQDNESKVWYVLPKERYIKNIDRNYVEEHFPVELC